MVMKSENKTVRAWEDQITIPTYPEQPPDKNPMFFEKRVYQGSSGKVYPNPITDRVSNERSEKAYKAVFLENEYLHLMILPEIGGRIHIGQDKTNGYDFFYRQNVIKPALVGLLGPWISGGVEFNWPQHHRPSTYMPVQHTIKHDDDGSTTIWLSEHDPMVRMKGMVGICLHPGKSYIEAKVRLYNRTPFAQTFLWWANVGIRVHDQYQAFFPPDVTYVADHAKRAISFFPIARNFYYGIDYRKGVDISWYRNIPVPTSYMVTESEYDFFGGYDYQKNAGVVHFANRHIAPGKKLWTWGNAEFGYAWDRNLTDADGPYIELMAGVFTDNQPDFSWLQPYETRTWSQFWYPIQQIGPAKKANRFAAVNMEPIDGKLRVGICVTESFERAKVLVTAGGKTILEDVSDLAPGRPYLREVRRASDCSVSLLTNEGHEIIEYTPPKAKNLATSLPEPATEPPPPKEIVSNDELYVTGLHLEQYRHATRFPEPYWEEALERDPLDSRCSTALGLLKLKRGQFSEAETHFRHAIERLTRRNPNPAEGEAYYYLGVALQYQDRLEKAYAAFYKATWNYAWQSAAYYHLAEVDCHRLEFDRALQHLELSLKVNSDNLNARNLRTTILRRLGASAGSAAYARESHRIDPLDSWSRYELEISGEPPLRSEVPESVGSDRVQTQLKLDLAFDYAAAGFWGEVRDLLKLYVSKSRQAHPIALYLLGYCKRRLGNDSEATATWDDAAKASPDYCFAARIEEMIVLQAALAANPSDARAHYYLGNLFYDKKRYEEAIHEWESSVQIDPSFAIPWRNLGIAYFNVRKDADAALGAYDNALKASPDDARLLYEADQLRKRTGAHASQRLATFESQLHLVAQRDDLTVEFITLLNQTGRAEQALELLLSRRFNPWEGGEGLVSGQYVWAHILLGRSLLESDIPQKALAHFSAAREYPQNLGEGKHLLTRETHLDYFAGLALSQMGRGDEARTYWTRAAADDSSITWLSYYRAMGLDALGRKEQAASLLRQMGDFARKQMDAEVKIDYFATSLPNLLLFEDDLQKRNQVDCLFLLALSELGLRKPERAKELLNQVLSLDCNHIAAQQEIESLTRVPTAATVRP
jgi:tetratricopeptide (TPR) repeat protein